MITPELIDGLVGTQQHGPQQWYTPLVDACAQFEIDTPEREAAWLAQCAHESGGFEVLEENLNYSESRLLAVFPKYFDAETVKRYARKPDKIANRVYADRMGNGSEVTGDGWKYRGRGLIQLTGATNYRRCGEALRLDLLKHPDLLTEPQYAALSAAWFWYDRRCNVYADSGDFVGLTRRINGGINGMDDRLAWLDKTRELMA